MKQHFTQIIAIACMLALMLSIVPVSFAEPEVCEHDYQMTVIEPTYFEEGYEVFTCKLCGDTYQQSIGKKDPNPYFLETEESSEDWTGVYMLVGTESIYSSATHEWYLSDLKALYSYGITQLGCSSVVDYCYVVFDMLRANPRDKGFFFYFEKSSDPNYPDCYTIRSIRYGNFLTAFGNYVSAEKADMQSGDIYWHIQMSEYGNLIIENSGRYLIYNDEEQRFDVQAYYSYNGTSYPAHEVFPVYLFECGCECARFEDIDLRAWYHEGVEYGLKNEIFNGMGENTFSPNMDITRAQLVTILYRIAGKPSVEGLENPFTDVAQYEWFSDAVTWAANEGIVNGITPTTFDPHKKISREQIATILYRYTGKPAGGGTLSAFPDAASVSRYAVDAMTWAVGEGLINGMNGKLVPLGNATRAQIATILYRYLSK